MEYAPLTLTDFKAGLYTAREPWLSPKETFRALDNAIIYNGRAQCRNGYVPFGSLCEVYEETMPGSAFVLAFTYTTVWPFLVQTRGGVVITDPPGTRIWHDRDGDGIIRRSTTGVQVGTINYATGFLNITALDGASPTLLVITYRIAKELPVTGLHFFNPKVGGTYIIATDTVRAYLWNAATNTFDDLLGADTFSGGIADLFQMVPFDDMLILNNGIDPPYKFELPASCVPMATDFDGDAADDIDAAQFVIRHRNRILFLGTTENGVRHPGRVRRTSQGNPEAYDSALDASDAPTNRDILSAGLLGDNIVIQFNGSETWSYRYTGDLSSPYEWVQVSTVSGAHARLGTIRGERTLFTLSLDGVHESDGIQNQNIDDAIEGAVAATIDPSYVAQTVCIYLPVTDQVYWSGVEVGETQPSRFLVYDAKKQIWTTFLYGMRALAVQVEPLLLLWDQLEGTMDSFAGVTADQLGGAAPGAMQLYGGDDVGVIHRLNVGDNDNGQLIPLTVRTQLIAPFGPTVESRLGWVDVVLDRADGKTATVSLFREYDSLAYATQVLDLTGTGGHTKVRRRIRSGQLARFHQVEIAIPDAGGGMGVDLIELHVAPARGGMRLL